MTNPQLIGIHKNDIILDTVKIAYNERLLLKGIRTLSCENECFDKVISKSRLWHSIPTLEDNLISLYTKKIGGRMRSLYDYV